MLEINPGLMIWTFIIFIGLLVILGKTAWKPLLASLKTREQAIADSLDRAEQARADAERLIAENQKERVLAEAEIQKALKEGRDYAEKMRKDLVEKAKVEAARLLAQARLEIEHDTQHAIRQLRSEAADLAILATSKLLDENMNEDRHRAVINKMIADMPDNQRSKVTA
ncbi:MAG: F0F1 ATP synthase subunit B [Bacteroidota bacterium]|nr:F0F1 ATP synthase subunit B [Bacteroidota bacterium]MDP4233460.1 F0F1 ATP synthase subunit B [Bacteroidota bacterium]MDP4242326.1 F0F1 ATP synthase subunit B [Bacteroidota bacterium]MDP4287082.1 F0F1 ATP synthase subunit B [Bacteroidota bacterium]